MDRFVVIGRLCGYPECCIREFCDTFEGRLKSGPTHRNPFYGTGYVPCKACCDTFTIDEMLNHIAQLRDKRLPTFPDQTGLREIYNPILIEMGL